MGFFCDTREADPLSPSVGLVADYLLDLQQNFQCGKTVAEYLQILQEYWPARYNYILESPIIKQLLDISKNLKPIVPELNPTMWDPDVVLNYMLQLPQNTELEPEKLVGNLVVLLMLSSGRHKSDLLKLDICPQHML